MAFRGTFDYTLDVKNRLTIPARFRAIFADGLVLGLRHDVPSCISVWRPDEFDRFLDEILTPDLLSAKYAVFNRFYNANSHDLDLDSAGRVGVPGKLIEQTSLGKEVVIIGAGRSLEVWNRAAWTEHNGSLAAAARDILAATEDSARHVHPA